MKRFITSGITIILLTFVIQNAYSQLGITYYSSNAIGANLPIFKINDNQISGELRVFANRELEYISTEADLFYRFKQKEYHRFAMGIGLKLDPFSEGGAIVTPVSLEFFPFQNFKKASFLFELAPEIYFEDQIRLRSMAGLRYSFGK